MKCAHSGPYSGSPPLSGVPRAIGPLDGKIYARPVYKGGIMRKILAFMVAALALLQVWSVIGQEDMQESLSLDSEVDVTPALGEFRNVAGNNGTDNASNNGSDNLTQAVDLVDDNRSATATQEDFLDKPVNQSLIDRNLTTTASQNAFLEEPVNESLIDITDPGTATMREFLIGEPVDTPAPFFKKGQMMGSATDDSEAEPAPSFFKKGQMMGT